MATWQPVPDRLERAPATRDDSSAPRLQGTQVPLLSGGRVDPRGLTPQAILTLQRTIGNQAVNALLRGRIDGPRMVQRCGAVPCDCAPEEKATHAAAGPAKEQAPDWMVQRAPPTAATRTDVAIVLTDEDQDMAEAHTYAATVLRVTSPEDARDQLKALGKPIGILYVVSHSNAAGEVEFTWSSGTLHWTPISELGSILKQGFVAGREPISVDFRGCKVGAAGDELEKFRAAAGSQSAKGSTCWSFSDRVTPLTLEGVEIKSPSDIPSHGGKEIKSVSDIPKGLQSRFDRALLEQLDGLRSEDGHSVKNCLRGLAPGEKADRANLRKIWDLYWANEGNLVAVWASPQFNHQWQEGSICAKDMTEATKPCAIVNKTGPAAGASSTESGSGTPGRLGGRR